MKSKIEIKKYLIDKGFEPFKRGFSAWTEALILSQKDENAMRNVTKILLPTLAKLMDTTSSRIERWMRYSLITSKGPFLNYSLKECLAEMTVDLDFIDYKEKENNNV